MTAVQVLDIWVSAFPACLCLYVLLSATLHVMCSETRGFSSASTAPLTLSLLVPARNEERGIAACLSALLEAHCPGVEIHVLSDGSTDATVEIARGFEQRSVHVHEFRENMGKSHVLECALAWVRTDLVMIVDADTRLAPTALREMIAAFADPSVAGATANIQVQNENGLLERLQAVEYASIIGLLKRANGLWGGLFTVSGAASCFRTEAVREAGGFRSPSITEDIELSWRLQHRGGRLVYVPRALAFVDVPVRWRALWTQRCRWSQGLIEVLRLHGAVWRSRTRALALFAVEGLLSISWIVLLAVRLLAEVVDGSISESIRPWSFGFWQILTLALFACQTATAGVLDSHYAHFRASRLLVALVYPFYFILLVVPTSLIGWCRGLISRDAQRWERSAR